MDLLARPRQAILSLLAITKDRPQSREEEFANSLSHAAGLLAALAAGAYLIATAVQRGSAGFIFGTSIYAATMVGLYLASTLYHGLPPGRAKAALLVCDHSAIFLFIAGSFTPFAFGVLGGPWGLALLVVIWGMALAGVTFKIIGGADRHPNLSTSLYVAMGWVLLLAAIPVWHQIPTAGLYWLLAGGLAYTTGVAFFRAEGMRYAHFTWHWFVLAGSLCHFIAVLRYAAGP